MQSTERFGRDSDRDGDGVTNELTRADITAVALFQAVMAVPGRVIPNNPKIERAVATGERLFQRIGCAACHIPGLPLTKRSWIYTEPNPYNPPGNLQARGARTIGISLFAPGLPQPRLVPSRTDAPIEVPAYPDFRLHDICDSAAGAPEALDQNQPSWSTKSR